MFALIHHLRTRRILKMAVSIMLATLILYGLLLLSLRSHSHSLIAANVSFERDAVMALDESNVTTVKPGKKNPQSYDTYRPMPRSKCSEKSDARGKHQKVAAFSLYGNNLTDGATFKRYVSPLIETARNFSLTYPGWIMRIYHNCSTESADENWKILYENFGLASPVSDHVDLCYVNDIVDLKNQSFFAMTWRFLPLLDDFVDTYVSRDSDSVITQREIDAVHEWLKINRVFHAMRDHPHHCIPMLGGLWGAKVNQQRDNIRRVTREMFSLQHRHVVGFDQDLLAAFIWPLAQQSLVSHDSYCCDQFDYVMRQGSLVRPFPTQRAEDGQVFVGNVASIQSFHKVAFFECPLQCRPIDHLNWTYC